MSNGLIAPNMEATQKAVEQLRAHFQCLPEEPQKTDKNTVFLRNPYILNVQGARNLSVVQNPKGRRHHKKVKPQTFYVKGPSNAKGSK